VIFVALKKVGQNFFSLLSPFCFCFDPGPGIRDPGFGIGKNQDPGSTSRIRNTGQSRNLPQTEERLKESERAGYSASDKKHFLHNFFLFHALFIFVWM
jgi:hypothetical protein